MRTIKTWNGRGGDFDIEGQSVKIARVYVAAHSRAEASRLLKKAGYHWGTEHEIAVYYSPCWGDAMQGIAPEEIGVWVQYNSSSEKPSRLI